MQVLVTGGTGFIGSALLDALTGQGHTALVLSRQDREDTGSVRYVSALEDIPSTETIDAVVNLAGASLAARRWSRAYKREIVDSRVQTTADLLVLLARLESKPAVLLSGSAVGFYGHHGDEVLTEQGDVVPGFSQRLCSDWEDRAGEAAHLGVRVCLLRFGVVFDRRGGALDDLTRSFRLGVATWAGTGEQWLSWIHREDLVRAVCFLLEHDELSGPCNVTAPEPVTARQLSQALCEHFRTFVRCGVPAPIMRAAFGEVADELLLNGQRVVPARLQEAGFSFDYPAIDTALARIFEK
ncbi:MAG: TIGR01777 family oxidoreductase [Halioglobus sp.]|nr:TIGR01777 family oxidoreductase [Halioglobus sp.]